MTSPGLVLGVDGGGTKTAVMLADRDGNALARVSIDATNPNVTGIDLAVSRLSQGITACCREAACSVNDIVAAVFGIAGTGSAHNRQMMEAALRTILSGETDFSIESDARIAMEGALEGAPGIAVIAGTGSVVCAKNSSGEIRVYGGWGRVLGDGGSGYEIGREAATVVARSLDEDGDGGLLGSAIRERLGWTNRVHVLDSIYRDSFDLSTLAPLVLELAAQGDQVSQNILRKSAAQLLTVINAAIGDVGVQPVHVATCGGLIDHPTPYRALIVEELERMNPPLVVEFPRNEPVMWAILMALTRIR